MREDKFEVEIRQARESDARQVKDLETELYSLHATELEEVFKPATVDGASVQRAEPGIIYVATDGDLVVGYIRGMIRAIDESEHVRGRRTLTIVDLFVLPSFRRLGIATNLVRQLEAIAHEYQSLEIPVYAFNTTAREFYLRLGYETYVERLWKSTKGTHRP